MKNNYPIIQNSLFGEVGLIKGTTIDGYGTVLWLWSWI